MKNVTSFTDEEIIKIRDDLEEDYSDIALTTRKILNIAKKIDAFKFSNNEEKLLALEYASKMRGSISFYIDFMVPINQKEDYYCNYYNTIDYSVKKVVSTIYPDESFDLSPIDDKNLGEIVDRISFDLKNKIANDNKKSMTLILK